MTKLRSLAWGQKVSPEFREKLHRMAMRFEWSTQHESWLMACMAFETGRTFSPSVKNPGSTARGLIQFMSATARYLGTSTTALAKMTAVEQLYFVEKYFKPYASKIMNIEDMYMAILWPLAVGKSSNYVLWRQGTAAYSANKGLDRNGNGRITKAEATGPVRTMLEMGMQTSNVWEGA